MKNDWNANDKIVCIINCMTVFTDWEITYALHDQKTDVLGQND